MTSLCERVSKRSMDFANQRKAYLLRTVQHLSYERIAERVVNMGGTQPSWGAVRDLCQGFSAKRARRPYKYKKCGRKPWKPTKDIQTYVLKRLLADRLRSVVTSTSLAEDVAKAKGVILEASCIRKLLAKKGYKWLPRATQRKYSPAQKQARLRFAAAVQRLSKKALRHKLAMALDGVVLSMPPVDATERHNYCVGAFHGGETKFFFQNRRACLAAPRPRWRPHPFTSVDSSKRARAGTAVQKKNAGHAE